MALPDHQPDRRHHRPWDHPPPTNRRPPSPCRDPTPHLRNPRLSSPGHRLRSRPHPTMGPRRPNQCRQPRTELPPRPQRPPQGQVDLPTGPQRRPHLDQPPRPHLHESQKPAITGAVPWPRTQASNFPDWSEPIRVVDYLKFRDCVCSVGNGVKDRATRFVTPSRYSSTPSITSPGFRRAIK